MLANEHRDPPEDPSDDSTVITSKPEGECVGTHRQSSLKWIKIFSPITMATWDPGRFWQTLWYYDILPFSQEARRLLGETRDPVSFLPPVILVGGSLPPLPPSQAVVRQIVASLVPDLYGLSGVIFGLGSPADGMLTDLWRAVKAYWREYPARLLCDFRDPGRTALWGALDDVVMGGVSSSQLQLQGQVGLFTGTVSTANSGGFASLRTRTLTLPENLAAYEGISLRVRGDGQRYKIFLRQDPGWDAIAYSASFDTLAGTWQTLQIPFQDLIPVFRAKRLPQAPPFDPSRVYSLQIMLSKFEYDGMLNPHFTPGTFHLEIAWIGAWGSPSFWVIRPDGIPLSSQLEQTLLQLQNDPELPIQIRPTLP